VDQAKPELAMVEAKQDEALDGSPSLISMHWMKGNAA
jgi:hypothetical protein